MALFIDFLSQQWMLASGIVVCLVLLMKYESAKAGATLSPQELVSKVNQEQAVIVDLRDKTEFGEGHIVDALHIPGAKLAERIAELQKFRERPIVLVCKMGQHASTAGKLLAAEGFTVYRLSGGMMEWKSMQLPVVKA